MKQFHVFKHPDGRLEALNYGFSWPAAILGELWLCWHKMWLYGVVLMIVCLGAYEVLPSTPEGYIAGIPYGHRFGAADVLNIFVQLMIGIFGTGWRANALLDRKSTRLNSSHIQKSRMPSSA